MSENKRHLELAVVKFDGDHVTFRIADQTHRGKNFSQDGAFFKAVQFAVTGIAMRAKTLAGFITGESSPDVKLDSFAKKSLFHFPLFPFGALALFHFDVFFRPVAMEKVEEK